MFLGTIFTLSTRNVSWPLTSISRSQHIPISCSQKCVQDSDDKRTVWSTGIYGFNGNSLRKDTECCNRSKET